MATPVFARWSRPLASDDEQETTYKGNKHCQREAGDWQRRRHRYGKKPEGLALKFLSGNLEWCDKDHLKTISICEDILSNVSWGQQPRNDCRVALNTIVNDIRREQAWHDARAHRHATLLRQHEDRNGRPVFCAPLTAHWNGRSEHAGKRPRASEGVVFERCVVQERVTVSERMCRMR